MVHKPVGFLRVETIDGALPRIRSRGAAFTTKKVRARSCVVFFQHLSDSRIRPRVEWVSRPERPACRRTTGFAARSKL